MDLTGGFGFFIWTRLAYNGTMDYEKLIAEQLNNPSELEKLYRQDAERFVAAFDPVFAAHSDSAILQAWKERLHYQPEKTAPGQKQGLSDVFLIIVLSLFAGTIAKLPAFIPALEEKFFYPRNLVFAVLPAIAFYFILKNRPDKRIIAVIAGLFVLSLVYMNLLPVGEKSDTLVLASLHLPIFLWMLVGLAFTGNEFKSYSRWADYIRFTGEVAIYSVVLLIGGMVLTFTTLGLFSLLGLRIIDDFYMEYVVVYGIAASPIVAIYLTGLISAKSRSLTSLLARIFTPLALITLLVYLAAMILMRMSPYSDREFLLIFDIMLFLVLGIAKFTLMEQEERPSSRSFGNYILFALILVAMVIDLVALSASFFRLTSLGLTPNRLDLLAVNLLIFVNLTGVIWLYFRYLLNQANLSSVRVFIIRYLPAYSLWSGLIVFGFPLLFWFK